MRKVAVMIGMLLSVLMLAACSGEDAVLSEAKQYALTSEIRSLDIQISAADFTIEEGERFSLESNLKDLTVSERNGVLTVIEDVKHAGDYTDAMLRLCVPKGTVFEEVEITTGAARLTAEVLSANSLELELGAGKVHFGCLNAYSDIEIEGGAGEITVVGGVLNDLSLRMGVGRIDLTAALLGKSDLEFGVGASNVTLVGNREDYRLDIEKGLGSVTVDGKTASDQGGTGQNRVTIKGGVGTVDVAFREE